MIFEDLDLSTTIVKKYNWINPRITLIYILFKFKLYLLLYILFKYRNRKRRKSINDIILDGRNNDILI